MAASNYADALKRVLVHEGGWVHDKDDPGGETNKGVTRKVYDAYRKRRGLPIQSVRYISNVELQAIYRQQYWDAIRGDELPAGIDYAVFDGAVNSGPGQAVKWLQRALDVRVDGAIGEVTLAKVREASASQVINSMCDQRMAFLRSLRHWAKFGKGWTSRVSGVRKAALVMARNAGRPAEPDDEVPEAVPTPEESAKATANDTAVTKTPAGEVAVEAGKRGLVAFVLDIFNRFSDTISMFTGLPSKYVQVALGLALAAVLLSIVYLATMTVLDVLRRRREGEDVEA